MIKDVIRRLQKASVRPNDFTSRYSELLDRLWQRKDVPTPTPAPTHPSSSIHHVINAPHPSDLGGGGGGNGAAFNLRDVGGGGGEGGAGGGHGNGYGGFGQQDEFSWLDLQAVGELVSGEPGFGGVEGGYGQGGFMAMGGAGEWGDQGVNMGEDFSRFF